MTACEAFQKWISRQMDGELSGEEAQRLEEHLASCTACARYRSDLYTLRSCFAAEKAPSIPSGLTARVMTAARLAISTRKAGTVLFLAKRLCAAAAILCALTLGLLWFTSSDKIQAEDRDREIHFEDLFGKARGERIELLKVLTKTTDPKEALRIYSLERKD